MRGPAPQAGLDPGTKLDELKGPREDVVRACVEAENAGAGALGIRQQDQRAGVAAAAELLADRKAIAVGEGNIKQHDADTPREHPAERLVAQGGHLDLVAFLHETIPDVEPPLCVAVHDHDVGHASDRKLRDSGRRSLQADANPL